jgi:hypothetical protein
MNTPASTRNLAAILAACAALAAVAPRARSQEPDLVTAVSAETSRDYVRARLPNGSYEDETYAFGRGGYFGAGIHDESIDNERFMEIARTIARPLADQDFLPTKDPRKARLLIMVYWGATEGLLDPASDNFAYSRVNNSKSLTGMTENMIPYSTGSINEGQTVAVLGFGNATERASIHFQGGMIDSLNASILGYASELAATNPRMGLIHNIKRDDLIDDIEHSRYFVVLMAYDFQQMWTQKKHKLLWETRFSIREQGTDFRKTLPAMAAYASQYFGQDTHGLVRRPIPEGKVEVGVPKTLGIVSDNAGPVADTTLIADSRTFSHGHAGGGPDMSALPAPLAAHFAAYQREKTALQDDLAARMTAKAGGADARRAIDAFNAENATRIAALNRDAEGIRSELARFAAVNTRPAPDQSVDALVRQFNDRVQEIEIGSPLLAHP